MPYRILRSVPESDIYRCKIFFHGLDADSTDENLIEPFSPFGPIEHCSLVRDKITGRAKGYRVVIYKTWLGAENALKEPKKAVKNLTIWCQLASVGPVMPVDSVPSGVGEDHWRNLAPLEWSPTYSAPLVENPVFVDAVMSCGLVNAAALGGAMRSAYGGGRVGAPYGGGSGASYAGGATRLLYAGEMLGVPYRRKIVEILFEDSGDFCL